MLSYEGYPVWIENEEVFRRMNNHCDVIRGMEECFGLSDLIYSLLWLELEFPRESKLDFVHELV